MRTVLALALGLGFIYPGMSADIILKNGDFSKLNSQGRPINWSVARFMSEVSLKNNQLKVKINSIKKQQGYIAQTVNLQTNRIYRLTGELKSSRPGVAFFQVKAGRKRFNSAGSGTQWKPFSITFSTGKDSKATILCRFNFSKKNQGATAEFRNPRLVDTGLTGDKAPTAPENLLQNSSFEMGMDARQTYAFVGDPRQDIDANWKIDANCAYAGKKSLLMTGKSAYVWNVLHARTQECVFSVYLKAAKTAQVELGLEPIFLHTQGGIAIEVVKKSFSVSSKWQRCQIAFKLKKKLTGYSTKQLYRVWVRPVTAEKIWADAAQLETGRTVASVYSAQKGGKKMYSFYRSTAVKGPTTPPEWKNKKSRNGKIQLTIANKDSSQFKKFPVSAGIPFPPGELFDADAVKIIDRNGRTIPAQSKALARRHTDGSIISLLLDFQAESNNAYTLNYGGAPQKTAANLISSKSDKYIIDTGAVQAVIDRKNFRGFDSVTNKQSGQTVSGPDSGCFVLTPDDKRYSSRNGHGKVVIERNGPLHAVIRASGEHRNAAGNALLHYIVRIHAYAGKPYFLIESTFENRELQDNTLIKAIGLELPWPNSAKVICNFADGTAKTMPIDKAGVEITQLHEVYGRGKYQAVVNPGKRQVINNRKIKGFFYSDEATLAIRNFWQLNPKAVKFTRNKAIVYHWPEREVKYADLPFGLASTISIAYAPFGSDKQAEMLVEQKTLLQTSPEWISASGVFGNFLTTKTAARQYPRYHQYLQPTLNRLLQFSEVTDFTGMGKFGEFGACLKRLNNESVICMNLWLQYMRSGNQKVFKLAQATTRHQREVDVCHANDNACFMHTHCALINTSYMFHTGHFWITGLIWHYLMTGDMRSYNVARGLGANLLLKYRISHYKGRERARMLLHLADLYELTHLECFRHAYETQYNFGQETTFTNDYYIGIGLLCLKKWYDVTGEKKYLKRFIKDARKVLKLRLASQAAKPAADTPVYSVGAGRDWYVFQAMAEAARTTGDKQFITAFYDWMAAYMIHPVGGAVNVVQGSYFLEAAKRLGIGENPLTPQNLLGIAGMTGCYCSQLKIMIAPWKKATNLYIYRVRNRKKRGGKPDQVKFNITAPNGKKVCAGTMSGPAPLTTEKITLSPVAKNKFYQLDLRFENDAWGAVGASTKDIFLDANQYFAARMPALTSEIFEFVAVPSDKLAVSLRWRNKNKITPMGKIFGVLIQDLNGKTIAAERWAVPVGTCFNQNGGDAQSTISKLIIPIPSEYRNKPVKLIIAAPKATRWRLKKLKSPLLGREPLK